MKNLKNILKKLMMGFIIFLVVILGISFIFGTPVEEIIANNNKKIKELKNEKEYINEVDNNLKEVSKEMYDLSMDISNDLQNNTLNKAEALLKYKQIGDKITINTEKIPNLELKVSLMTIEKNINDSLKASMSGITNMDVVKFAESLEYTNNVLNEMDNYILVKDEVLKEVDKQIKQLEDENDKIK